MLHFLVLGWAVQTSPLVQVRTYYVAPSVCDVALPHFYEDAILSWSSFGCDDVRAAIRDAFDEWQHNSLFSFREVDELPADTRIDTVVLNGDGVLARVTQNATRLEIDRDTCWYTDRGFCATIARHDALLWALLVLAWVSSGGLAGALLCLPMRIVRATTRIANWAIFVACPLVLVFVMRPCTRCHDFRHTMMHEVGHTLGFLHTDEVPQRCGCGAAAAPCILDDAAARATIMHSRIRRGGVTCLDRNDVDGLRSIYGGDCAAPVWCYETSSDAGIGRLAVALLYGFLGAWLVVAVRSCAEPRAPVVANSARPRHPPGRALRTRRP